MSLFRLPGYPAWFGADTFLLAGSAVHWIVMSVMAYQLSGSLAVAGWFATARGVMSVVTQVTGGTFIDRHDHRTLILVQAGTSCLIWLTMGTAHLVGLLTFPLFATLCLTSSAVFGFLNGTTNAALIRVVGPERYAQAESLNQGRDAAVNTAGSPLGGALFGLNQAFPFFASALFDAAAFVSGLLLHLPADEAARKAAEDTRPSFVGDLVEGWRWALSSTTVVVAVAIAGLMQFATFCLHQAVSLSLVAVGTEPLLISLANVGIAGGIMVGSLISSRLCDRVAVGRAVPVALACMALAYVPMALWTGYPVVVASTFAASLPLPLLSALLQGFVFSKTPVERQGRTRSVLMATIMLITSASGAVAGELMVRVGFSGLVVAMVVLLALSALAALVSPHIRRIPASGAWQDVEL